MTAYTDIQTHGQRQSGRGTRTEARSQNPRNTLRACRNAEHQHAGVLRVSLRSKAGDCQSTLRPNPARLHGLVIARKSCASERDRRHVSRKLTRRTVDIPRAQDPQYYAQSPTMGGPRGPSDRRWDPYSPGRAATQGDRRKGLGKADRQAEMDTMRQRRQWTLFLQLYVRHASTRGQAPGGDCAFSELLRVVQARAGSILWSTCHKKAWQLPQQGN